VQRWGLMHQQAWAPTKQSKLNCRLWNKERDRHVDILSKDLFSTPLYQIFRHKLHKLISLTIIAKFCG
jgi:hypothetical protein